VGGIDIDRTPRSCIDPRLANTTARKHESVRLTAFHDGEVYVTVSRNVHG
jgi:hypothetical protein